MLLVLGNGIAGATAARVARVRQPSMPVAMVSDEHPLPYSRTALMYVFMGQLRAHDTHLYDAAFWQKNRIDRIAGRAAHLDTSARTLHLSDGRTLAFERLVVATGSSPRRLDVPGEDAEGVVHLYGLADLGRIEAALARPGPCVVVGGGLTGVELCEMLRSRGRAVTLLVREPRLLARTLSEDESDLAEAELRRHGVDVRTGVAVAAVETAGGAVSGVTLGSGEALPAALVAVAVGVAPNVEVLRGSGLDVQRGVAVAETLETNVPGIFAAGDCAELPGGAVEQLWYTGRAQGAVAGEGLAGAPRRYAPALAFNSAKVFTKEWTSAGLAPGVLPAGLAAHTLADARTGAAVRLVSDAAGVLVGASAFGVRLRQSTVQGWIARRTPVEDARTALRRARFDAEFEPWRWAG